MTLNDLHTACAENAAILGDYKNISKTDLANGYCDAEEAAYAATEAGDEDLVIKYDILKNAYYAALMLRYWYKIFEWIKNSASLHLDPTEFFSWLDLGFYVAFYYKAWRYENEATVKNGRFIDWKYDAEGNLIPNKYYYKNDDTAVDKIINRCCGSIRGRQYQELNTQSRRINTQAVSIEDMFEELGDTAYDQIIDTTSEERDSSAYNLVKVLLQNNKGIEALIVDSIANADVFKIKTEDVTIQCYNKSIDGEESLDVTRHKTFFDERKLVKHLSHIEASYMDYFCLTYDISEDMSKELFKKIKATSNIKLYQIIHAFKEELKNSPQLLTSAGL